MPELKCNNCDVVLIQAHPPSKHLLMCPQCNSIYQYNSFDKELILVEDSYSG